MSFAIVTSFKMVDISKTIQKNLISVPLLRKLRFYEEFTLQHTKQNIFIKVKK